MPKQPDQTQLPFADASLHGFLDRITHANRKELNGLRPEITKAAASRSITVTEADAAFGALVARRQQLKAPQNLEPPEDPPEFLRTRESDILLPADASNEVPEAGQERERDFRERQFKD